ncbi:MAG: hypothetical protein JG762_832 [Deferribacteraceae bacterium]|jgi:hypothetical protein|nr:hypothetical protein [Deferribacteraceae bacterium]
MGRLINNKGMALITTLILALIASTIIGSLMYLLNTSTTISGSNKSYISASIAAKSAADYIIYKLVDNETELCGSCNDNSTLDLSSYNSIGNYDVKGILLNKIDIDNNTKVYAISVSATNNLFSTAQLEFTVNIQKVSEIISGGNN